MKISLPAGITSKYGRQLLKLQKVSPTIAFGAGVVGLTVAGVLACRNTLRVGDVLGKAEERIDLCNGLFDGSIPNESDKEYTEKAHKKDLGLIKLGTAGNLVKLYAIPAALAMVSVGLLTGSHVTLNRRNASLGAAYAGAAEALAKYRERVRAELGDEQDKKFRFGTETVEETVMKKDGSGTKVVKNELTAGPNGVSDYAKFFDQLNPNWQTDPEINKLFLQSQQSWMNSLLQARGHVMLNDVYDALGIPRTGAGCVVGWVWGNGDNHVDFGIFDDKTGTGANRAFVNGLENSILLDFNVDGEVFRLIEREAR